MKLKIFKYVAIMIFNFIFALSVYHFSKGNFIATYVCGAMAFSVTLWLDDVFEDIS